MTPTWMLYGATGYTGQLVVEEAVAQGHRPLLAARNPAKLKPLAEKYNLPWQAIDLSDTQTLTQAVAQVQAVYHAAGPFIHTAQPMRAACLLGQTHYIDITGELNVFEATFALHEAAQQRGISLISGAGFDVIPTDSLALYVAHRVENPVRLEIAIAALSQASAGTTNSMLEMMPLGAMVRQNGELRPQALGHGERIIRFPHAERTVIPIPWGDLSTAYRSTGIANIQTYMAFPPQNIKLMRWLGAVGEQAMRFKPLKHLFQKLVNATIDGPSAEMRAAGKSYVWAQAIAADGSHVESWLETGEAYQFTAHAAIKVVEQVLDRNPQGALSPAQFLGPDFVLTLPKVRRLDALPSPAV